MQQDEDRTGFQRHVRGCNNATLPGDRVRFLIEGQAVGWVAPRIVAALEALPGLQRGDEGIGLAASAALPAISRTLAERGLYRWRDEAFDVRSRPDGPSLTRIDRGAIPAFGIQAVGVHVNGLVRRGDGLHIWVAKRAMDKLLDPGKLDHMVAGGVPAGLDPAATLLKEAKEEAAVPFYLARSAVQTGLIDYTMDRPEGLRRDRVYCYDLMLPEDFLPQAVDGEVEAFELWPLPRAVAVVHDTDDFKFNVNLVLIDLFIRQGLITGPDAARLQGGLQHV